MICNGMFKSYKSLRLNIFSLGADIYGNEIEGNAKKEVVLGVNYV